MITPGTVLIEPDALRPRCFEVAPALHQSVWMCVKHTLNPQQLEKELSATGWTYFFMAGPVRATAFGFNRDKAVYAALNRCIDAVRQQKCNCLQIEMVEMHSFVGIPYVSVSVRPRHIQKSVLFAGPSIGDGADKVVHEVRRKVAVT